MGGRERERRKAGGGNITSQFVKFSWCLLNTWWSWWSVVSCATTASEVRARTF